MGALALVAILQVLQQKRERALWHGLLVVELLQPLHLQIWYQFPEGYDVPAEGLPWFPTSRGPPPAYGRRLHSESTGHRQSPSENLSDPFRLVAAAGC